jgi:hypothetical protein
MPNPVCTLCAADVIAVREGGARILCARCAAQTSALGGLPIWPDLAQTMRPAAHGMMPDDDDNDGDGDDEEEDKPKSKKSRDDDDDDDDDRRPRTKRRDEEPKKGGMGLGTILGIVGVALLCCVCLPISGVLAVFLLDLTGGQARVQSINNLKQIGFAFHSHEATFKHLPFNGSDQPGRGGGGKYSAKAIAGNPQSGSWAFQILPYVDQGPMYATVDKSRGVAIYMCPGRGRPQMDAGNGAWTDYFINGFLNDPKQASKPDAPDFKRSIIAIPDGTSNTVMVGHGNISSLDYTKSGKVAGSGSIFVGGTIGTLRAGNNADANPTGVFLARDSAVTPSIGNWGGPFSQGALMCMGDASVRTFPYATANFGAFLTPAGNEMVMPPDS